MTLVQPIVVKPAGHEETVLAAAIASAVMLSRASLSLPKNPWGLWLENNFTKSVRRTKTDSKFSAAMKLDARYEYQLVGEARALAFEPTEQFDPVIAKLQVTGLECPRAMAPGEKFIKKGAYVPRIIVTDAMHMSTGKMAAQAAHGLGLWAMFEDRDIVDEWRRWPGASLEVGPLPETEEDDFVVVDSGLTEIPPGTPTVVVTHREISQWD